MVKRKILFLLFMGIIFHFLLQGWSDAYTFSTNSVGALSTVKITDMSGSLPGSAITVSAWDANGKALTQSGSAAPLTLSNHGTTNIAGTDLMARFPTDTPMLYSFTINSSMTVIANVKTSEDGLLNFPITFTNGLSNFAINTVGPFSTVKITDMSGSLSSSGSAITVSAWDTSGNALTQSGTAAPLTLSNHGTTTIAGTDLMARFSPGTPMAYQFAVPSSKYIFTNVKKSADATINVPIVFTSGTTNYSTNSVGSLSTLKITDMSGSLSSSGTAITVTAWDASGNALTPSASAAPLTLCNHCTTTIKGIDLAARFLGGPPMTYEFTVGSSQYIVTNVKSSTDGTINIPTVFSSGTNNFTANSVDPGDTIKITDLSGSIGSSGADITVSAWDASGTALTQSGNAAPLTVYNRSTTTITGSALTARFTGTTAAYEFSVASPNFLITTVKSTSGGTLHIPNVVYTGGSTVTTAGNILTVTVDGSLCSSSNNSSYPNKPCVSVTVCSPGTQTCQIIDDILLDTGSYGLRIFRSLLTGVSLPQVNSGSGALTECVQYADGSADWGPVQTADVVLGNEPPVTIPIQVIDSSFGTVPASCGNPDTTPQAIGFNGILGVGLFAEDCGSGCANSTNNGIYYACSGSTCVAARAPVASQVQNPVAHLPVDNNGLILQLPTIPLGGMPSVNGSLILGIGTQSNNTPRAVTTYPASSSGPSTGDFTTVFNGITFDQSFIDSGSNGLFFDASSIGTLPACTAGIGTGWFCPSSTQSLSATNRGFAGSPSGVVSFQIGNASILFSSSNNVFIELGAPLPGPSFDWGLPFFLGRSVYVGIEGKTSSLGTGPYWAY
jgi:hypothetical protein